MLIYFPFSKQYIFTFWAFFLGRLLPGHKVTFRMILTAKISSTLFSLSNYNIFAAFRTINIYLFKYGFVFLHPEIRTCQELTMGSIFYDHISATVITYYICNFIFNLNFSSSFSAFLTASSKIGIKIPYNGFPSYSPILYTI